MTPPIPINPTTEPWLLVSVRNATEAHAALVGCADVIDVKEPSRGPLGMADADTIAAVLEVVAGRAVVTAALGELIDAPSSVAGVQYVKLGLAGAPRNWRDTFDTFDPARFVPVAYADHTRAAAPDPRDVLQWAIERRCAGFLIDTFVKDGSNLFDHLDPAPFIDAARAANLTIALAGSLCGASFTRAAALRPDILAVRGAACTRGDRTSVIDAAKVRALREMITASHESSAVQPVQCPATPA